MSERGASWRITPEAAAAAVRDVPVGHGKLEVVPKVHVGGLRDVATLYTPGVGTLVKEIVEDGERLDLYSNRGNTIAVVTDGTAVLGFGAVGPRPAVPVMEGKAIMFKLLAGLDAVPLCLETRDADHLADVIAALEPSFGGINLEDVAAPHCFDVVRALEDRLSIPVFHDDQYGTATVVVAGVLNALAFVGKTIGAARIVVNGAGAAGTAAARLLLAAGAGEVIVCDRHGILTRHERQPRPHMDDLAARTNRDGRRGHLKEALAGADAFVGLSTGRVLAAEWIATMARDPAVFACANPEPEIMPDAAQAAGAAVVGSGRFDFPNQCNNVLAFPGIMRAAVDTAARRVTETMCLAAASVIAGRIPPAELSPTRILPGPLDPELCPAVAEAVAAAAVKEGLARRHPAPGEIAARVRRMNQHSALQQENLRAMIAMPPPTAGPGL